jgi:hypothetical protein
MCRRISKTNKAEAQGFFGLFIDNMFAEDPVRWGCE